MTVMQMRTSIGSGVMHNASHPHMALHADHHTRMPHPDHDVVTNVLESAVQLHA